MSDAPPVVALGGNAGNPHYLPSVELNRVIVTDEVLLLDLWGKKTQPGAVYADASRRASYLKMYGNICFDTRENYINFPWSSETK